MGLSRQDFYSAVFGPSLIAQPMLMAAYEREEQDIFQGDLESSPHGEKFFTSFHASSFPGDDPYACGRLAVYGLMNPPGTPIEPWLRAWFDLGTELEHKWVKKFKRDGRLLSADVGGGAKVQTNFLDEEHWLSGSCDAIVLPPNWTRSHFVEIKTTGHDRVVSMREGGPGPNAHEKYIRQLKTYIGLGYELPYTPEVDVCKESWAILRTAIISGKRVFACPIHQGTGHTCEMLHLKLEPPTTGEVIYSSREEPLTTASFFVEYDKDFMDAGRAKLAEWRDAFIAGILPGQVREEMGEKPQWSIDPCQYCKLKPVACKQDWKDKVERLEDSHLIEHAKSLKPEYDYEATRAEVLERWAPKTEEVVAA